MTLAADRILPLCDLLLGAAYADDELLDQEKAEVRALLAELAGDLPDVVDSRIEAFDPKKFDLARTAATFKADPADDRRKLLFLVSAVSEADDELDLAEDDYLRALAAALDLPATALAGIALEYEVEDLQQALATVRKGPPPVPPAKK